jgi:hypothetical protein
MKKLAASFLISALLASPSFAADSGTAELQQQINDLQRKFNDLESSKKADKKEPTVRIGGYGELDYIFKEANGNRKEGNTFDPHRFVLYVNSNLSESITLNTELEWEHGGDSGKGSEIAVEQFFLDFRHQRPLNFKAGLMLVPLGGINLGHEPTNFNSTERPELDKFLLPSTWREMGAGIYGALGSKVDYQLLVMNGLNGFTKYKNNEPDSGFSAKEGLRKGRQKVEVDNNDSKAIVARLEVRPVTNLYTNFSAYRGDSADAGKPGAVTTIAAFDGKYSLGKFDLSGEYVYIDQKHPERLSTEIGDRMSGYWVEGAYHVLPESLKKGKLVDADVVAFARYSAFDTQQGTLVDPTKASGLYDRNYTTVGVVFKPVTTVSIKADYQIYDDHRSAAEKNLALDNDKFQVTIGFVF